MSNIIYNKWNWPMDIVHDFSTGAKSFSDFYLEIYSHQTHETHSSADSNGLSDDNKWQIKFNVDTILQDGSTYPVPSNDGAFTRTKKLGGVGSANSNLGIASDFWSGITSPEYKYPFTISAVGNHSIELELWHETHQSGAVNTQSQDWNIFQKAVAVTKNGGGVTIAANTTHTHCLATTAITLNNGSNRGDEVSSWWTVYIADSDGIFQIAAAGADYTLVSGTLGSSTVTGSDTIELLFDQVGGIGGIFRVVNSCSGWTTGNNPFGGIATGSVNYNIDSQANTFIVEPDTNTYTVLSESITFPNLKPLITETSGHSSFIANIPSLSAYENFYVNVGISLPELVGGAWTRTVVKHNLTSGAITTTTFDIGSQLGIFGFFAWVAEILFRCDVNVVVTKEGIEIERKKVGLSLSNIELILGKGNHIVKYEVRNKINPNDTPLESIPVLVPPPSV